MARSRHQFWTFYALLFSFFIFTPPLHLTWGDETGDPVTTSSSIKTKTVIADLLMIDENFYVVRGDRGEIRIEVTPETKLSEAFKFGDRIKAVLLPNDEALSITRALPGEPTGIIQDSPALEQKAAPAPSASSSAPPPAKPKDPSPPPPSGPQNRLIIADLLMVDGSFYVVRTERGEVQIEITPSTQLAEKFKFGDRIKAIVTPNDKALSVVRASAEEPNGIQMVSPQSISSPARMEKALSDMEKPSAEGGGPGIAPSIAVPPGGKVIIADLLMVDGDFYVVRGERGEIRIEITPNTVLSEKFKFGDRIKAVVLPNDKALSVERASR